MTTQFSIEQNLNSGTNTVVLPETGLTLIGVSGLGLPYMSIQLSAGKKAIIPMGNASGSGGISYKDPMVKVSYRFNDISFYVDVPNAPTSPVIFYFGTPSKNAIPLEALTGVVAPLTFTNSSTTAGAVITATANFSFPEGKIMITGANGIINASYMISQFQISTGKNIYLMNVNAIGEEAIHPLDIEGSQAFSVSASSYVAESGTNTGYLILYYMVR